MIPGPLRKHVGDRAVVEIEMKPDITVDHVLRQVASLSEEAGRKMFKPDGSFNRFLNVYVNEEDIRHLQNLETKLVDGAELSIITAIAGG
jgi:molybdopterin converting factor small subunit